MRRAVPVMLCILLGTLPLAASAQADAQRVDRAIAYLAGTQNEDGGFPFYATMYVEAAAQAGRDPKAWPSRAHSAFAKLEPYGDDPTRIYNSYTRIVYAASTAGFDARHVNGVDYLARVRGGFAGAQSGDPTTINDDMWAILALRAAGIPADDPQIQASAFVVANGQAPDGGWQNSAPALRGYTDMTGMALAALAAAEVDLAPFQDARIFLDATHVAGGGHTDNAGNKALCQSTVWALIGYEILGAPPSADSYDFLRGLQRDDGGFARKAGETGSDEFCTTEVVPLLAGEAHPFPGYVPATIREPTARARENATFGLDSAHDRLTLTFPGQPVSGSGRTFRFPAAGSYHYDYLAEGPGYRARGSGEIDVRSARPIVGALPAEVVVHRPAPLSLDLSSARDPDGQVVGARIDWGDGNLTNGTSHAYARPGEYLLAARVVDDAGEWSTNATMRVLVPNRAPEIALPARVVGDRVHGATLVVDATDPDGDAVNGTGSITLTFDALGNATREFVVTDAYGATARANVTIEVVNLPPSIVVSSVVVGEGEIDLVANTTDPDGPAPNVTWIVAGAEHAGARVRVALPPGEHPARAIATDADGARVNASLTITLADPSQPQPQPEPTPQPDPPKIRALDATLYHATLTVRFDASPDAALTLRWRSDTGEGERSVTTSPASLALPGARWATVTLTAERAGLVASRDTGLVVDATATAPSARVADADAAPVVVAATGAEAHSAANEEPLETSAVAPTAPREAPMPSWLAMLAAIGVAAALARARR